MELAVVSRYQESRRRQHPFLGGKGSPILVRILYTGEMIGPYKREKYVLEMLTLVISVGRTSLVLIGSRSSCDRDWKLSDMVLEEIPKAWYVSGYCLLAVSLRFLGCVADKLRLGSCIN